MTVRLTKDQTAAAISRLKRMTGRDNLPDAVDELAVWKDSHEQLARERRDVAALREASEAEERVRLNAVIKLHGFPTSEVVERMPIDDLREYVSDHKASRRIP